ncbi:MAG: hypothetical protein ACLTT1_10585 [[Clostridium] scindens]
MTMNKILEKLRKENKDQYRILGICIFLSILLVSSYAMMYFSPAIQKMLPEGGDTRKLCWLMFGVTVAGCTIFTIYGSSLFLNTKAGNSECFWRWESGRSSWPAAWQENSPL